MKILMVIPYFYPKIGGTEQYALSVATELQNAGHKITVVTTGNYKWRISKEIVQNLQVIRLPVTFKLSNTPIHLFWFFYLRKIIREFKPDIINTHSPVPFLADIATRAARQTPVYATYHSGSMLKGSGGIADLLIRGYEQYILKHTLNKATRIGAVLPSFVLRHCEDERKVVFMPPGINTSIFKPNKAIRKKIDITYVGRIEKSSDWKGIQVLLDSVALIKRYKPSVTLRLIGSGDAIKDYMDQANQLGIKDNLEIITGLSGAELVSFYQETKIVVLPSKTQAESFGMVLAEAMACETAVIGSRIGGIPNLIRDKVNGLLAEPNNSQSLATAINLILDNDKLADLLSSNGRKTINESFTLSQLIRKTENILRLSMRPKIVHVCATYPPHLGGLEKVVEELAYMENKDGFLVDIFTSNLNYKNSYTDRNVVKRLKAVSIANLPVLYGLLPALLRIQKHSILHIHAAQAFIPEIGLIAAKIRKSILIIHFHLDVAPSGNFGFIFNIYKKYVFPITLRNADSIIVFSENQKKHVIEKYGIKTVKIAVVPNGVDKQYFIERSQHRIHSKHNLLFVGRLSPQKNIQQLLLALDGISEKFQTRVVGEGQLKTELKLLADNLNLKNVAFVGRKDGVDLINEYAKADIFVLPSEREGMPLVALEAMAASLPIIANDVLGVRDVIINNKNGLLVTLSDHIAMREALIRLTSNMDMYNKLSTNARKTASDYSWEKVAHQIESLYLQNYV